ncbi:cytochrome-c peroxidase [Novipirellula artificiosorum]|uniref:Cytochrome c551 peroxidase n=1 Tax=Novipirellula artificiosorum TaxID=2528016 RepID=A0A5C6E0J8_9BACT|nr:cytochrome c peroxidase [Novipirellula artificiosorum]TWU42438.1 Cytochrome c551 peroxidase precursor [Novipirellula artificiosorum]
MPSFFHPTAVLPVVLSFAAAVQGIVESPRTLNLPETPYNYTLIDWPKHFLEPIPRFDNTPSENQLTDEGATLGRVLFYDKTLSKSGTVSCASCHKQSLAFTDDAKLSVGHTGDLVARNSMSLVNSRFYQRGRFFWDERARTLEQQVLMPIEDPIEMGHTMEGLVKQLNNDPLYPPLVEAAFEDSKISQERIASALAQFVRSIVSYRSKYDWGRAQVQGVEDPFPNFTDQENEGKAIFLGRGRCASCHMSNGIPPDRVKGVLPQRQSAFFYMVTPVANGIDSDVPQADPGVGGVNGVDLDQGRFKSPSLRNIEVTGPYMHDGRFKTLYQVIEHYNWSVRPHPNLGGQLEDVAANGMGLPTPQKDALEAFLMTLTDQHLLRDPKYADPFVSPASSK